jgi:hypothetical protein
MGDQGMFERMKTGASMYAGHYRGVAGEVGSAKALALHEKQCEGMGMMMGEAMRAQLAGKALTPHALAEVIGPLESSFGMSPMIEETPDGIIVRHKVCPFYDGYRQGDLDHAAIGSMCDAATAAQASAMDRLLPQVSMHLEFRKTADDVCVEAYELKR